MDVPEAESVTIKGDLGSHTQPNVVVVRVADETVYAKDTIDLLVDTSGLANKKSTDMFELEALQTARNDKGRLGRRWPGCRQRGFRRDQTGCKHQHFRVRQLLRPKWFG